MAERPEIIVPTQQQPPGEPEEQQAVSQPGKLIRIASMIRELVEEVRQAPLDEGGAARLATAYRSAVDQLHTVLSEDLREELEALALPLESGASQAEVRIAQAQLLGWLEGLFHGIQAALFAQQMQAQAALEEVRRRQLPSGPGGPHFGAPGPGGPPTEPPSGGQYL